MNFKLLISKPSEWLRGTGPDSEIVMSSRIRLARNIEGFPYPNRGSIDDKEKIVDKIEDAVSKSEALKDAIFIRLDGVSPIDKQFLLERHLISKEQAMGDMGNALIIGQKEIISIMINEEDHLRIQVIKSGFQLFETLDEALTIDNQLEQLLPFSFSTDLGYLSACPTNVGTGLRASVMLHLPALVLSKQIGQVLQATSKLGLAIRGLYGEGTEALGNLFQISNQVTLGFSEEDITRNSSKVIRQIIGHERNAREMLLRNNRYEIEDKVLRAYGILQNARIMNSKEAIHLLSMLRLGVESGILADLKRDSINELFILTQPAHLQKLAGKELESVYRDIARADLLRQKVSPENHTK